MEARPVTPEEAKEAVRKMHESMDKHGVWNKLCVDCGLSIGGRLAEYGEPDAKDLALCYCPRCHKSGARTEFIPAKEKS